MTAITGSPIKSVARIYSKRSSLPGTENTTLSSQTFTTKNETQTPWQIVLPTFGYICIVTVNAYKGTFRHHAV